MLEDTGKVQEKRILSIVCMLEITLLNIAIILFKSKREFSRSDKVVSVVQFTSVCKTRTFL